MENQFSEQDSLRVIQEMIEKTKKGIKDNGFFFLLWGWLVLVASLSHFAMLYWNLFDKPWLPWPLLMTAGGIASGIYGAMSKKEKAAPSYVERFMGYLWGAFSIALLIVLGSMVKLGPTAVYPFILVLYGIGTFVTGGVLKFRPLLIGGVICWICAIGSLFVSFDIQLLLIAVAVLFSYIIPGHILKANYNNV
jgi:hypothetical protein